MRRWLFCFQKSVALVLSKLLLSSSHSFPSTKAAVAQYNQNQFTESQQTSYQMQYTGSTGVGIGFGLNQSDSGSNNGGGGGSSKFGLGSGINAALKVSKERLYNMGDVTDNYGNVSTNRTDGGEDKKIWLAELGNGHGKHSALAKRRITFSDGVSQSLNPSRSNSMFLQDDSIDNDRHSSNFNRLPSPIPEVPSESLRRSVWDRSYAERSVVDLTRMSLDGPSVNSDSSGNNRNNKMISDRDGTLNPNNINDNSPRNKILNSSALQMGKSPMIPINDFNMGSSFFDAKLAGSYSDSMDRERVMVGLSLSPPETERFRSLSEESRCSDQSTLFANEFGDDSGRDSPDNDG